MARPKQRRSGASSPPEPAADPATPEPAAKVTRASRTWDGPALRNARENAGISVQEMSSRTKINVAILRALEEERFEEAPKARVYVRGFVRCMAEEMGLDPEAVARAYVPRWEQWFADRPAEEYI